MELHMKAPPMRRVQKVCLSRGFGLKLEGGRREFGKKDLDDSFSFKIIAMGSLF